MDVKPPAAPSTSRKPEAYLPVCVADFVRRYRILQALTDFAEFLENFDLTVRSRIDKSVTAFDHLLGRDIGSARIGVSVSLNIALIDQPAVRLAS